MTVLLASLHSHQIPYRLQSPPTPKTSWLIFYFVVCDLMALLLTWFGFLFFICTVNHCSSFSHSEDAVLWAFAMSFRWNLRLQNPWAERPLWGRGAGQVHGRGSDQDQREAGLRAAEGAHVHHPGLWLRRGTRWRQHEEITQVSGIVLEEKG